MTKEKEDEKIDVILAHFISNFSGDIIPGSDVKEFAWLNIDNLPENLAPNIIPALKHFGFIK